MYINEGFEKDYYFKLSNSVFIAFYISDQVIPLNGISGLCLSQEDLNSSLWFEEFTNSPFFIQNYFNSNLAVKIILSGSIQLDKLDELLSKKNILILKKVSRNEDVEIIFSPKKGGIRLQKENSTRTPKKNDKIKVLIVDDSSSIRTLLKKIIQKDSSLEVVAEAERPSQVEDLIVTHKPDVMTLDIHMPEMDGVTLLKKIIKKYPLPTIMISSISMEEGPIVLNALESGAVDYIQKPGLNELPIVAPLIIEKIKTASLISSSKILNKISKKINNNTPNIFNENISTFNLNGYFILMGASTGGTEALKEVLTRLPERIPPLLIVQHIPPVFSKAFADRLNQLCPFVVKEAEDGEKIEENCAYIAPGGKQMKLKKIGGSIHIVIDDSPPVNRHKPSVDVLFESAVSIGIAKNSVCALLTGMGADGAKGLLSLKNAGALLTLAQDEESSVVYGMPKEAAKLGAAHKIMNLYEIPREILIGFAKNMKNSA